MLAYASMYGNAGAVLFGSLAFPNPTSALPQDGDSVVDMDVDLPARLGFPLLPRVPIRRVVDEAQQQDGHSIANLSAASQHRLPRLVLVVDTNVLICSVARRVVATIGKLLRPVSKDSSASGVMHVLSHGCMGCRKVLESPKLLCLSCLHSDLLADTALLQSSHNASGFPMHQAIFNSDVIVIQPRSEAIKSSSILFWFMQ